MKKIKRYIIPVIIILVTLVASNFIIKYTRIEHMVFFKPSSLFTYFGVLIGFSITIYTFGLSMIGDIKRNIDKDIKFTKKIKEEIFIGLKNGFNQIKEDIWMIFVCIILVIIFSVLKGIPNPFGWEVEKYNIPETVYLTLFILATISMYDIIKTMFNLSDINMELLNS